MAHVSSQGIDKDHPLVSEQSLFDRSIVSSTMYKHQSTRPGSYSPSDIIQFDLPTTSYIAHPIMLSLTILPSATNPTYTRFQNGIWSCISRIRWFWGSTPFCDQDGFALRCSELHGLTGSTSDISSGIDLGVGSTIDRNAWGTSARQYLLPLLSPFYGHPTLPLAELNQRLRIEVYLASGAECVETDGTTPTFTLSAVALHLNNIQPSLEYRFQVRKQIDSGAFSLRLNTWKHVADTLASGSTSYSINMPVAVSSLRNIMAVMRTSSTLTTTTTFDKMTTYNNNNVSQYQFRLNGRLAPQEAIVATGSAVEVWHELQFALGKNLSVVARESFGLISEAQFPSNGMFVIAYNFSRVNSPEFITGANTSGSVGSLTLLLTMSGALGVNNQLDTYYEYDSFLKLGSNGFVQLIE